MSTSEGTYHNDSADCVVYQLRRYWVVPGSSVCRVERRDMNAQGNINDCGFTWGKWFSATCWRSVNARQLDRMIRDWRLGADPRDWRLLLQDPDYDRFNPNTRNTWYI